MSTDATPPTSSSPSSANSPSLPDDLVLLKQMIEQLLGTLHERDREVEQLQHRLNDLLRRLYGPRAERYDPNQQVLFDLEEGQAPPDPSAEELPAAKEATSRRKARPHGRRKLPDNLRREIRIHELAEAERLCPCCGKLRVSIGEDVSEQLDYHPASLFVIEHQRVKYACAACEEHVVIAAKPPQPIDKGLPGPGLLAQVVVSKYFDHLPLHRQERIFERQGLMLHRSTTCTWMAACAELLTPLHQLMSARLRQSKVIWTDDTPVDVLDRSGKSKHQGCLWVYLGDTGFPYTVFDFTPTRSSRDGPKNFLKDFEGYLQADAFSGYDAIYTNGKVHEVACWAHARRKFYEARTSDAARSHYALGVIRQLYKIEEVIADWSPVDRAAYRQLHARPVLTEFNKWFQAQQTGADAVLPKSPINQAIRYTFNNWNALNRYTDDGDLTIDNNASERTIRLIAIGRKNWLFAGSDNGGKTAAILFSFTATCQRHKIDPFVYLRDLLTRMPTHPPERLDELLIDRWIAARNQPAPDSESRPPD